MSFLKLDKNILDSSLFGEPPETRIVFITMCLLTDPRTATCCMTSSGLARRANISLGKTREALAALEAPDPDSRSPEEGGRRIVRVDGGWRLVNFKKYRDKDHSNAERQAKHRERVREVVNGMVSSDTVPCGCCGKATETALAVLDRDRATGDERDSLCRSCNQVVARHETGKPVTETYLPLVEAYLGRFRRPSPAVPGQLLPSYAEGITMSSVISSVVVEKEEGGPGEEGKTGDAAAGAKVLERLRAKKAAQSLQETTAAPDAQSPAQPPPKGKAPAKPRVVNPLLGDRDAAESRARGLMAEIVAQHEARGEPMLELDVWRSAAKFQGEDGQVRYKSSLAKVSDDWLIQILDRLETRASQGRPRTRPPRDPADPKAVALWNRVKSLAKGDLPPHTYELWFVGPGSRRFVDGALEILCANQAAADWLREQYGTTIEGTAEMPVVFAVGDPYD